MGCNCKRGMALEDQYGEKMEESSVWRVIRFFYKVLMFALVLVLGIVLSPVVVIYVIYKMVFGNGGIKVPKKIMEMASKG